MKQHKGVQPCSSFCTTENNVNLEAIMLEGASEPSLALSLPKNRLPSDYFEDKEKLKDINHPAINKIIGYALTKKKCYLIEENYDAFIKVSETWENVKEYIKDNPMYLEYACKMIYCVAHAIDYLKQNGLEIGYFSANTVTYTSDFVPKINGACVPEVFDKSGEDEDQLFADFCKELIPYFFEDIDDITVSNILDSSLQLPCEESKIEEFKALCESSENNEKNQEPEEPIQKNKKKQNKKNKGKGNKQDNKDKGNRNNSNSMKVSFYNDITEIKEGIKLGIAMKEGASEPSIVLLVSNDVPQDVLDKIPSYATLEHPGLNQPVYYGSYEGNTMIFLKRYEGMATLSSVWVSILPTIDANEYFKNLSYKIIYVTAHAIDYLHKNNIPLGYLSIDAMTFTADYTPIILSCGLSEVFTGESKDISGDDQIFSDFCKSVLPNFFNDIEDITVAKILDQSIELPNITDIIEEYKSIGATQTEEAKEEEEPPPNFNPEDVMKEEKQDRIQMISPMGSLCAGVATASVMLKNSSDQHIGLLVAKNKVSKYYFCDKKKLTRLEHPAINQPISYTFKDNKICVIMKRFVGFSPLSTIWEPILPNLKDQAYFLDIGYKFVYIIAHAINYLHSLNIAYGKISTNSISFASDYSTPILLKCGLNKMFNEAEGSIEEDDKYFSDFCKAFIPSFFEGIEDITIAKILDRSIDLPISDEVIEFCDNTPKSEEKKEVVAKKKEIPAPSRLNAEPNLIEPKKLSYANIKASDELYELTNDIKVHTGMIKGKNSKGVICLSGPADRVSEEYFNDKGVLSKINHPAINSITNYCIKDDICYFSLQKEDGYTKFNDLWENVVDNVAYIPDMLELGCRVIYSVAHAINYLHSFGVALGVLTIDTIALDNNQHPLILGAGLSEFFDYGTKGMEADENLFSEFCRQVLSYHFEDIEEEITTRGILDGSISLPFKGKQVNKVFQFCEKCKNPTEEDFKDQVVRAQPKKKPKKEKKKKQSSSSSSKSSSSSESDEDDETVEFDYNKYLNKVSGARFSRVEGPLLTDPFFEAPSPIEGEFRYIDNIVSHISKDDIYEELPLEFVPEEYPKITGLESEFQGGRLAHYSVVRHICPNDKACEIERAVLKTVLHPAIPFCLKHKKKEFFYDMNEDEPKFLSKSIMLNYNKEGLIVMFISLLYNFHQAGCLYLRPEFNNIFICDSRRKEVNICGFDTCKVKDIDECFSPIAKWDKELTEATDLICLGAFIYYVYTEKPLFGNDYKENEERFKEGIVVKPKGIITKEMAKFITKLLSPDPEVRKTVDLLVFFSKWNINNDTIYLPYFGSLTENQVFSGCCGGSYLTVEQTLANISDNSPDTQITLSENQFCMNSSLSRIQWNCSFNSKEFSTQFRGKDVFNIGLNHRNVYITIFIGGSYEEVQFQWKDGVFDCACEGAKCGMKADGAMVFEGEKFQKKIEEGKLVIDMAGKFTIVHGGKYLEFIGKEITARFEDEKIIFDCLFFNCVYTPDEVMFKTCDRWMKYTNERLEMGCGGARAVLTPEIIEYSNSFVKASRKTSQIMQVQLFDKIIHLEDKFELEEFEDKEYDNTKFQFPEISYVQIPSLPMQAGKKKKKQVEVKEPPIEERQVVKPDDFNSIDRHPFDQYYQKHFSSDFSLLAMDIEMPVVTEVAVVEEPPQPQQQQQQAVDEEEPVDFNNVMAANKIERLLNRGESISLQTHAKIVKILEPKKKRTIVVTSGKRIFFTNIGGDGVLGEILTDRKSSINQTGCDVKVLAKNGSFHFIFDSTDDANAFSEKFERCIR